MRQGIVSKQVLDVFTTQIIHVPRLLNLLLPKLVRKNVPKMMYVESTNASNTLKYKITNFY
jgi:hypothetical protein